MEKKLILVPTDFTKVGDNAINHAVLLAKNANAEVTVLHIVPKSDQLEEAKSKLNILRERTKEEFGFEVNTVARVGTIFEDIGDLSDELDATMVVMGTHGMRGLQFITGSRALKVVTSAKAPFIIVQERPIRETGYDDIVVPLDLHKETKQKLSLVADMAKYFHSRAHIIVPSEKDEFLKNTITRNLRYAESFFEENRIPFTTMVKGDSDNFDDTIIAYATEIDADLIAVMNLPEISLANLIGGNYVQNIITNKSQIPAMLLNPRQISDVSIFGAYVGAG
jgi:nucleotide-binding universal stress UspA family protein